MPQSKGETTLGVRLKSYRRNSGLSQAEFARKLGLPQLAISLIEHDRRRPSPKLLRRMANILNVRTDRLFLLSPPDAKLIAGARLGSCVSANYAAWRAFTNDHTLLARYNVQPKELRVLANIRIIGRVRYPRELIDILTAIRQVLNEPRLQPTAKGRAQAVLCVSRHPHQQGAGGC
jgi:transcriptional regulator with XRE-family HTH domain